MKKPVLLYVDDDSNDLLLFEDACREANASFYLQTANDGEHAMDFLKQVTESGSALECPALVLLDIKMPRLSGLEILQWIRTQPETRNLPVIVFTSSKHEVDIKRAYELGANSYLVKTVEFPQLIEIIKLIDQYWIKLNQTISHSKLC
jgi:CheY-like chemotaxis protein